MVGRRGAGCARLPSPPPPGPRPRLGEGAPLGRLLRPEDASALVALRPLPQGPGLLRLLLRRRPFRRSGRQRTGAPRYGRAGGGGLCAAGQGRSPAQARGGSSGWWQCPTAPPPRLQDPAGACRRGRLLLGGSPSLSPGLLSERPRPRPPGNPPPPPSLSPTQWSILRCRVAPSRIHRVALGNGDILPPGPRPNPPHPLAAPGGRIPPPRHKGTARLLSPGY